MTDAELLKAACDIARQESHDPRTQNAAVLVRRRPDGTIDGSVWAANRFPRGVEWDFERKYDRIEHAERAVIYAAAKEGWKTAGTTMYVPWFACPDCARAIAAAGVSEVVGMAKLCYLTPARWRQAVFTGESILRESGVSMRWAAEPIGASLLFNGREVLL